MAALSSEVADAKIIVDQMRAELTSLRIRLRQDNRTQTHRQCTGTLWRTAAAIPAATATMCVRPNDPAHTKTPRKHCPQLMLTPIHDSRHYKLSVLMDRGFNLIARDLEFQILADMFEVAVEFYGNDNTNVCKV